MLVSERACPLEPSYLNNEMINKLKVTDQLEACRTQGRDELFQQCGIDASVENIGIYLRTIPHPP